jgi:hypothetical protein
MSESEPPNFPRPQPSRDGGPPRPPKITARGLIDDNDGPQGESVIDEIARRMAVRFPSARVQRRADSIAFIPDNADGFIVRLTEGCRFGVEGYIVHYGGSLEEFATRSAAILQFGFGLSNGCRVREYSRGGRAYRWVVELWDARKESWRGDWDHIEWGVLFRSFWRRRTTRLLQNHLIDLTDEGLRHAA